MAGFLGECCQLDLSSRSTYEPIRRLPRMVHENNRRALGKQRFNRHIEDLCKTVTVGPVQGVSYWHGLGIEGGLP